MNIADDLQRRRARRQHRESGVTLIELLTVGAVIAVLAALAIPSYRGYVLRANRTEARAALLALATAQEKFHLQCHHYATGLDPEEPSDCDAARLAFPALSERGRYSVRIAAADASGWRAEALPTGPPQSADGPCQVFGLASTGRKSAADAARRDNVAECWGR